MPFAVLIFRTFVSAIPRELDEAAIIDGASSLSLFFRVIFPLLRPAMITVIVADVGRGLQRLRQPAVLPARQRQRHGPADALQLPEPVQHAVEPAVRGRAAHHHPAAHPVHLLPAPDRVRHDRRLGQGLSHVRLADTGHPQGGSSMTPQPASPDGGPDHRGGRPALPGPARGPRRRPRATAADVAGRARRRGLRQLAYEVQASAARRLRGHPGRHRHRRG